MTKKTHLHFERISDPLLPPHRWHRRVIKSIWLALMVVGCALFVGVIGYHTLGGLGWVDAILEASMILGGMGAVAPMTNNAVKLFASVYALFSGFAIISITGIILAPWLHRMIHKFHQGE